MFSIAFTVFIITFSFTKFITTFTVFIITFTVFLITQCSWIKLLLKCLTIRFTSCVCHYFNSIHDYCYIDPLNDVVFLIDLTVFLIVFIVVKIITFCLQCSYLYIFAAIAYEYIFFY